MSKYTNSPVATISFVAAGMGLLLLTSGCGPRAGDDVRSENAPPVNTKAPVPADAPAAAAGAIAASQAQGSAMATKAATDGDAYKQAREKAGQ
jgi:hypothetical protein